VGASRRTIELFLATIAYVKITRVAVVIAAIVAVTGLSRQAGFEIPKWAFPSLPSEIPSSIKASDTTPKTLGRGSRTFSGRQISDALNPPDWYPDAHPVAPDVVLHARRDLKYACGLCHLPDGQGRSENATIAGLPEAYFRQQVADMRAGVRESAMPFPSSARMKDVAVAATDSEIAQAARYFASIRPRTQYRVKESTTVPRSYQAGGLYALRPGGETEPLGDRMMEISDDIERHEMRDPNETFTVYVKPGTLAKGKAIALTAAETSPTRCATCHGTDLRGGTTGTTIGPPIAGRSPLYLLRQLLAFKTKSRNGTTSAPMQTVTASLSLDEMIAAAAYAGSKAP
jgi:cytochrome c553